MLVKLLMEVFPNLLAVMMAAFEEMVYCFVELSARWAEPHLRCGRVLVASVEREPFVDKFGDDSSFRCFESFECHTYGRPMDGTSGVHYPGEFGYDVLKVLRFGGFVPEGVLHLLRDHNSVDAQMGEAGRQAVADEYGWECHWVAEVIETHVCHN